MRDNVNISRRADLTAALKRAKADDILTLEALAIIWGTTKPRFVSVRNTMPTFPQPMPGERNVYIYPAREALQAMLDHETRHDEATKEREARQDAIIGRTARKSTKRKPGPLLSVNEIATLSRLAAEAEERERDQGMYVPVADNAALAGEIFSEISEFHRELSNKLDPHGRLAPEIRATIDKLGQEFLLRLHRRMRDVLSPDAKPRANRRKTDRTRKA